MSRALPPGWIRPGLLRRGRLAGQFARELDPAHPLARARYRVIAVAEAGDSVVVEAETLTPRYYLLHLSWDGAAPRAPHAIDRLEALRELTEPPPDRVDFLTLWVHPDRGGALVEHRLDGGQRVTATDLPGAEAPADSAALHTAGWVECAGPYCPLAELDGRLRPTGQVVEYWVRPVIDDFMLLRAIETPGEPISLRKLIPQDGLIVEFDGRAALEAALPPGFYRPCTSPQEVGFGRAALP